MIPPGKVPFSPGRMDATQAQADVESFGVREGSAPSGPAYRCTRGGSNRLGNFATTV